MAKSQKRIRTKARTLWVSPAEDKGIVKAAKRAKMPVTTWMRSVVLEAREPKAVET